MKRFLLSIIFVVLFVSVQITSYGQYYEPEKLVGPTIKGLTLGMNVDDAIKVLNEKFPSKEGGWLKEKKEKQNESSELLGSPIGLRVFYSPKGKVVAIWITSPDDVFGNVKNITAEQFAQELFKAYGISEATSSQYGFKHRNEAGWSLSIALDKRVELSVEEPLSQRKFD